MVKSFNLKTSKEALQIKHENTSSLIYSGGTDLMIKNIDKDIIFINNIKEYQNILEDDRNYYIGACVTHASLLKSAKIPELLRQSVSKIASLAIRNMATLGGNICNASPAADTLPILYLYNAKLKISSISNTRYEYISDFIKGPRKTTLKEDEIVEEIIIPKVDFTHTYYEKVGARNSEAISKVSFAAAKTIKEGIITDFRVCFGAVGPIVLSLKNVEKSIIGNEYSKLNIDDIVNEYSRQMNPISDQRSTNVYRKKVALRLLKYFLNQGKIKC